MRNILRPDFEQTLLLPPCVEDWIPPEHPARFIREVVAQSDLCKLGVQQPAPDHGGTCFASDLLLSVWLYGYFRKVRSCRALECACREDLAFVWLSGNHRPDHNALWRFWNANHKALRAFFKTTVKLAMDMKLVGLVFQAIDGTKIAGACSGRLAYDKEHLQKLMDKLQKQIQQLESDVQKAAAQDTGPECHLPKELQRVTVLREKIRHALGVLDQEERHHCHPQEPEAVRVRSTEGTNRFGYNGQAVVDAQSQIILGEELVARSNDLNLLMPMVEQAHQNTGANARQSAADSGYCNQVTLGQAHQAGIDLLMPMPKPMQPDASKPYHSLNFEHDAQADVVRCPQGHNLHFHHQRQVDGRTRRVYRNRAACKDCPVRAQCTKDKGGRAIDISGYEDALRMHYQRMNQPDVQQHYRRRSATVEPVFGRIKQHGAFRRFSFRGLAKAKVQWSMVCSAQNLRRVFTFWLAKIRPVAA